MQYNPKISQKSVNSKSIGPPPAQLMNPKELIKEQFYLERFLHHLQANSNMPTLPDQSVL